MAILDLGTIRLNWREDGDPKGAPVVFCHALGANLSIWDDVIAALPQVGYRYIRYDLRGHGLSDCPPGPYAMGMLIRDAEALLDHLGVKDCVFVGLSLGGMVAQGLAVKRLDLVRAMVLSSTATKIGTPATWAARIASLQEGGMESMLDPILERWFSRRVRMTQPMEPVREMLLATPLDGYIGCCHAIGGTDFYATTARLTLPTLVLAGTEDRATPPDIVRETAELIKGAEFHLLRGAGHVPPLDAAEPMAERIVGFLQRIAHAQDCGCGAGHHDHSHVHDHDHSGGCCGGHHH